MSTLSLSRPWLEFDLGAELNVLSWAINRPGLVRANRILWREVRNADLPPDLDVEGWLQDELSKQRALDAVTFLTSRDIRCFTQSSATVGTVSAKAVATVGLSNAERVGNRADYSGRDWGTINVALLVDSPMNETALIETLSIAVQARTAAVMDIGFDIGSGVATGTGTDCIAVAAPSGNTQYAGLHTEIGEAVGQAVYTAVSEGAQDWMANTRRPADVVS